jgi:hypothetical protein
MANRPPAIVGLKCSVADPDPGSGAFLTPWIRDQGWVKGKKQFFGLKYLNSLMQIQDPGWKKSDPGWKKIGSGINIPDQ